MKKNNRGDTQNIKLQQQVEFQLNRLLQQLEDLEEFKDDLEQDEIEETRSDTMEQMRDFESTLQKMMTGDMSLVSSFGRMQLAIQAAISEAFKTPEVIRLFAKKQPGQLRERLSSMEQQLKLKKISPESYNQQKAEILGALKKLGEQITSEEEEYLKSHMTKSLEEFENVDNSLGSGAQRNLLNLSVNQIKNAQN